MVIIYPGDSGLRITLDLHNLKQNPSYVTKGILGLKIAYRETKGIRDKFMANAPANTKENKIKSAVFVVEQMYKVAEELEARLLVLYMPRMDGTTVSPVSEAFASQLPPDVLLVDMTDAVKNYYAMNKDQKLYLSKKDKHPNTIAHKLIADIIGDVITINHLLPSQCYCRHGPAP